MTADVYLLLLCSVTRGCGLRLSVSTSLSTCVAISCAQQMPGIWHRMALGLQL